MWSAVFLYFCLRTCRLLRCLCCILLPKMHGSLIWDSKNLQLFLGSQAIYGSWSHLMNLVYLGKAYGWCLVSYTFEGNVLPAKKKKGNVLTVVFPDCLLCTVCNSAHLQSMNVSRVVFLPVFICWFLLLLQIYGTIRVAILNGTQSFALRFLQHDNSDSNLTSHYNRRLTPWARRATAPMLPSDSIKQSIFGRIK
jgi:hypothetical protein